MPTSNARGTSRAERVRREGIKLIALIALTVASFFITRAVAEHVRIENRKDAGTWHAQGDRAFAAGDVDRAVDAYRHALLRDRGNQAYALSLATALQRENQLAAAERILLGLREQSPDNPNINLQLARIDARRGDEPSAIRYYSNALYGAWSDPEGPRRTRSELITFLLGHGQRERAVSEIIAARANAPDTAAAHTQLGEWLMQAGEARPAREEFERAMRHAPNDPRALTGAGDAAFTSGDYGTAAKYLSRVPSLDPRLQNMRDVASLVVTRDPLAPRLGPGERRRRLVVDLNDVRRRLDTCMVQPSPIASAPLPRALDQDAIEDAIEQISRAEDLIARSCGETTSLDRALALIAGRHTGEPG
jgi:tetratricopeptide (TPR) repeat protein